MFPLGNKPWLLKFNPQINIYHFETCRWNSCIMLHPFKLSKTTQMWICFTFFEGKTPGVPSPVETRLYGRCASASTLTSTTAMGYIPYSLFCKTDWEFPWFRKAMIVLSVIEFSCVIEFCWTNQSLQGQQIEELHGASRYRLIFQYFLFCSREKKPSTPWIQWLTFLTETDRVTFLRCTTEKSFCHWKPQLWWLHFSYMWRTNPSHLKILWSPKIQTFFWGGLSKAAIAILLSHRLFFEFPFL